MTANEILERAFEILKNAITIKAGYSKEKIICNIDINKDLKLYLISDMGEQKFKKAIENLQSDVTKAIRKFGIATDFITESGKKMIDDKIINECAEIIDFYGYTAQKNQLIEEMAELVQALNKMWRYEQNFITGEYYQFEDNIVEEIADVLILLLQLIHYYNCKERVMAKTEYKIKREKNRIKEIIKNELK